MPCLHNMPVNKKISAEDQYIKNALIESILSHARSLIFFLNDSPKFKDDVTAECFLKNKDDLNEIRKKIPKYLTKDTRISINKRMAHITTRRIDKEAEENKNWNLDRIVEDTSTTFLFFLEKIESDFQSEKIKEILSTATSAKNATIS